MARNSNSILFMIFCGCALLAVILHFGPKGQWLAIGLGLFLGIILAIPTVLLALVLKGLR